MKFGIHADKVAAQRVPREHETAFLPAALEIIETPPSPVGRAIGASIMALLCLTVVWASVGTVDIVATAPGKIIPDGRLKVIQPFETGVVRTIRVRDGATVKAGDTLIELDPTISSAELEHTRSDLISAELDVTRLRATLSQQPAEFVAPTGVSRAVIETHNRLLATQTAEHRAALAEIDRQLAQKNAERDTIGATIDKLEAIIPLLQERVDVREHLYEKQLGSKLTYLSERQDLVAQQHELLVQRSRRLEIKAAVEALAEMRSKTEAEFRRKVLDDLTKAEQRAAGLAQDLVRAQRKAKLQILTSPIDGAVQQLAVHTIGGVVTPAQTLALIVPLHGDLEIEAMVSNRDIGFVHPGQKAEIKVEAFNFTRYGLLHGRVQSVSHDAIARQQPQSHGTSTAGPTGEPDDHELAYSARVALDGAQIEIDGNFVPLLPGMAVTVEIKTGSRRIISYLLSPLVRYRQEVMRER